MEQELFAYWLYTLRGIGAKKRHELQQISVILNLNEAGVKSPNFDVRE